MKKLKTFEHWSESDKLKNVDDLTGLFSDKPIDDIYAVEEAKHFITAEDYLKIIDYFKELNNAGFEFEIEEFAKEKFVDKTIENAAIELDSYAADAWMARIITALYPNKYNLSNYID